MKMFSPVSLQAIIKRAISLPREVISEPMDKIDGSLTPNMRALRLAMTLSEQLLSMGVAASDVVHMSLGITNTYCTRRVHIDVSSTLLTISQDRGIDREPLTLVRTIVLSDVNYQTIQALQTLALSIRDNHIPLDDAEKQMDEILTEPKVQPKWLVYGAGGAVSAGVVVLYDGSLLMALLALITGILVTGQLRWFAKLGVATFYSRAIAALCVTLAASGAALLNEALSLSINPTLMVIGGIVSLVAGMMIVGAFQDAIDEYYVTANARLLKVAMATGGIVVGVLIGLHFATRMGVSFPATPDRLSLTDAVMQYVGAMIIAAGIALSSHARIFGTLVAGGVGMLGWWVSRLMMSVDFGVVISTAIAAAVVGLVATFVSRFWKIPSLAIIAAGIVPLVPGLSLYNGLMGVVDNPPGDAEFMVSLAALARAIMIGFAVAAGATLGNMIGRPLRRRMIRIYNHLPRRRLSRSQQK